MQRTLLQRTFVASKSSSIINHSKSHTYPHIHLHLHNTLRRHLCSGNAATLNTSPSPNGIPELSDEEVQYLAKQFLQAQQLQHREQQAKHQSPNVTDHNQNTLFIQQESHIDITPLKPTLSDDNTSTGTITGTGNGMSTTNTGLIKGASPSTAATPSSSSSDYEGDIGMSMKPSEMVSELDKYIIGQADAKRAVAIACRQRWRRHNLPTHMRNEVTPKNILMIGPTGCGKTEIARRLAKLTAAPFIKVEATKYTEVGFHGKDVDSIITDLLRVSLQLERQKRKQRSKAKVSGQVEEKILDALVGPDVRARDSFRVMLHNGTIDQQEVEIEVPILKTHESASRNASNDPDSQMARFTEAVSSQLKRMDGLAGSGSGAMNGSRHRTERRKITIGEARNLLTEAELDATISQDDVLKAAIHSLEQDGIVFLDEIDKIASSSSGHSGGGGRGADASADGVQRDLLPLIEGTTVTTKHGDIKTDHILFIASGSFHAVKPSDLLAELQGRLPVRVELQGLTEEDLYRILTATRHNLLEQQIQLLAVDNIKLSFTDGAIREIARVAAEVNRTIENIGARRLSTVVERIVSDLSFQAPDMPDNTEIVIDVDQVREKVADLMKSADLQKYIL